MKYYNLLILFMITLKCGADEEPTTVNDCTVEDVTNSEVFSASTTEAPGNLFDKLTQLPNISKSTLINATDANVSPFKKNVFGTLLLPRKPPRQRMRLMTNIIGSLMKGLAQLNEPDSEEDGEDDDEDPTTVNYSTVENVTNGEVFNASTTEAPENLVDKWTPLPNINNPSEAPVVESTLINTTNANAVRPFTKQVFGKLPIPRRQQQGSWLMKNITGSLMKGLAQLNKPDTELDAEDDDEEPTTGNYSTIENVTDSEVSYASTTEAPENFSSELPGAEITLINATDANSVSNFKKKEVGTLPIPRKLPRQRTRLVTTIVGSLMTGLAQLNEPDSEEDDEEPTTVNHSTIENVTNGKVFNASTTEAPDNLVDKWTQLPNINSPSEAPVVESTLINATDANALSPFTKKVIGKLPILGRLTQQGTRIVTNIIGGLLNGQETDSN